MNTIITAAIAGLNGPSSDNGQLKQGANQTPMPKVWSQHIGNVLAAQLKPTTLVRVVGQGSTNDSLSVSHYGPCPEVPDGHDMKGIVPLIAGTQTKDDFGLPIAGAPAENQKLLQYQTAPGDPYALGISSKSPDGVTSPAIPNSGDVTPGTAASNPTAYLTGPVTKQHPWITDVVMIWGLDQLAYGDYDYTDPAGTVHPSLGKGDTKVKKPGLSPRRATNTTALYSGQVTLPGSSPTQYMRSGLRRANDTGGNDGVGVLTQWGTNIDKDDAVDVWLAASHSQPAVGTGDQTARPLPCYEGDSYNTSALGVDGGDSGRSLYVKADGTTITQTNDGKLRVDPTYAATLGGGGGGGGAGINATLYSFDDIDLGFSEVDFVIPWDLADTDTGSFWSGVHPSRLTIPTDGRYVVTGQVTFKTAHVSDPPGDPFDGKVKIWKNGNPIAPRGLSETEAIGWCAFGDPDDRITVDINKTFDLVHGDYLELVASAESGISPWAVDKFSWFTIEKVVGSSSAGAGGAAMLASSMFHQIVSGDISPGPDAIGVMTWNTPPSGGNNDFDTGSYFDPAHPTRLTIQADGIYELAGQIEFRTNVAGDAFTAYTGLNKNGSEMAGLDLLVAGITSSNPIGRKDTSAPISIPLQCVAGDYFELEWSLNPGTLGAWINGSSSWFTIKQVG